MCVHFVKAIVAPELAVGKGLYWAFFFSLYGLTVRTGQMFCVLFWYTRPSWEKAIPGDGRGCPPPLIDGLIPLLKVHPQDDLPPSEVLRKFLVIRIK